MQWHTLTRRVGCRAAFWCRTLLRRAMWCAVVLPFGGVAFSAPATPPPLTTSATGQHFTVNGARDGNVPAWTISAVAPPGWTADCCTYAKAIGVNFVLYRGEWTGHPQQVMVLNVWPRKLPTLTAEIQADRKHFLQADPAAKVSPINVRHPGVPCQATLYQGTDHVDDIVVFCEPAEASGIRWSWSMTLDASDTSRRTLLDVFMRVVISSRYAPQLHTNAPVAARTAQSK